MQLPQSLSPAHPPNSVSVVTRSDSWLSTAITPFTLEGELAGAIERGALRTAMDIPVARRSHAPDGGENLPDTPLKDDRESTAFEKFAPELREPNDPRAGERILQPVFLAWDRDDLAPDPQQSTVEASGIWAAQIEGGAVEPVFLEGDFGDSTDGLTMAAPMPLIGMAKIENGALTFSQGAAFPASSRQQNGQLPAPQLDFGPESPKPVTQADALRGFGAVVGGEYMRTTPQVAPDPMAAPLEQPITGMDRAETSELPPTRERGRWAPHGGIVLASRSGREHDYWRQPSRIAGIPLLRQFGGDMPWMGSEMTFPSMRNSEKHCRPVAASVGASVGWETLALSAQPEVPADSSSDEGKSDAANGGVAARSGGVERRGFAVLPGPQLITFARDMGSTRGSEWQPNPVGQGGEDRVGTGRIGPDNGPGAAEIYSGAFRPDQGSMFAKSEASPLSASFGSPSQGPVRPRMPLTTAPLHSVDLVAATPIVLSTTSEPRVQRRVSEVAPALQVAHSVSTLPDGVTELKLSPEELGRLRVELRTDGDRVSLFLSAERPETQDLLRRHADRLAVELRASGFQQVDLNFSTWDQSGDKGQGAHSHATQAGLTGGAREPRAPMTTQVLKRPGNDGLYLRM